LPFFLSAAARRLRLDLDRRVYGCFYRTLAIQEPYPVVTAGARIHDTVRAHPYLLDRTPHVAEMPP